MSDQISLFEFLYDPFVPKKIRLYQFFAGIGSQAKSLKNLGVEFEDYKIVEWAVPSIKAYNLIHTKDFTDYSLGKSREEMIQVVKKVSLDYNQPITEKQLNSKSDEWVKDVYNNIIATHNLVDISSVKGKDLEIDTNYTNIIFYSFPCQDLSKAGLKAGLKKDSGTRSGLLWEVERILTELTQEERQSCVLICENVADLIEGNFVKDFSKWVMRLSEFGFNSYDQVLNAKDYGIPQNRKRVFMVSLPGSYHYIFPRKMVLEHRLKNFLEKEVNKKYYLSEKMINYITATGTKNFSVNNSEINCKVARPLTTEQNKRAGTTNYICDDLPENTDLKKVEIQYGRKALNETLKKNEEQVTDGTFIDAYNRSVNNDVAGTITTRINDVNNTFVARAYEEFGSIPKMFNPYNKTEITDIAPTQTAQCGSTTSSATILIRTNTKEGYCAAHEGDGIDISGRMQYHRGTVQKGLAQTLSTMGGNDDRFVIIKPSKPIKQTLEKYGYPFKSKEHSLRVDQFNKGMNSNYIKKYLTGYDHNGKPSTFVCPKVLKYQFEEKGKYNYSNLCCYKLKKEPAHKWQKENKKSILLTGMRAEEGGNRKRLGCIITDGKGKLLKFHPLIKVDEEWENWFIEKENIKLAPLYYPPFNFRRTGCKGCPFSLDLQEQLEIMEIYLPNERKQCEYIWKPIYDEYRRLNYRLKKVEEIKLF